MSLNITALREHFPSLRRQDIFLDNPGGTQITQRAVDRMVDYLTRCNANHGGAFRASRESDEILEQAHTAVAGFLGAARPEEIVFGLNMTTLTLHLSRSLAHRLQPGDGVVVTRLDHDANIAPWLQIAEMRGAQIYWVDFHPEDGTLDLDSLDAALERRPSLVAVGYASNALGTINPVAHIVEQAHAAGALVFVDAVHYAPHGPIDVQQLGCDFLACSAYKFFGPHVGILYGRYDLLDELPAYKVRPAPDDPPGKFETGTQNHEGIAGVLGTIEYLEEVGNGQSGNGESEKREAESGNGGTVPPLNPQPSVLSPQSSALRAGMAAFRAYEQQLSRALLETLQSVRGLRLYGLNDPSRLQERVPTFSFTLEGFTPRQVAEQLGEAGIYVWDGNYYALAVTERLSIEEQGGMVRVGAVHYNTMDEIRRLGDVLGKTVMSR